MVANQIIYRSRFCRTYAFYHNIVENVFCHVRDTNPEVFKNKLKGDLASVRCCSVVYTRACIKLTIHVLTTYVAIIHIVLYSRISLGDLELFAITIMGELLYIIRIRFKYKTSQRSLLIRVFFFSTSYHS